jgi:hypothetical protein
MYPSVTSDYVSPEVFWKKNIKANNIFQSDYATRGFDMTLTMIRLVQNKSLKKRKFSSDKTRRE